MPAGHLVRTQYVLGTVTLNVISVVVTDPSLESGGFLPALLLWRALGVWRGVSLWGVSLSLLGCDPAHLLMKRKDPALSLAWPGRR